MSVVRGGAAALAVVMAVGAAVHGLPAEAGSTSVRIAGGLLSIPVISIREAKFKSVIQQQFDYSCGSAALATLLSFHYARPTTEAKTFEKMFEVGDQDAIRKSGFSLLDMKNYLETVDVRPDGFRISLDALSDAGIHGVAPLDTGRYQPSYCDKGFVGWRGDTWTQWTDRPGGVSGVTADAVGCGGGACGSVAVVGHVTVGVGVAVGVRVAVAVAVGVGVGSASQAKPEPKQLVTAISASTAPEKTTKNAPATGDLRGLSRFSSSSSGGWLI